MSCMGRTARAFAEGKPSPLVLRKYNIKSCADVGSILQLGFMSSWPTASVLTGSITSGYCISSHHVLYSALDLRFAATAASA